MDYNLKDYIEDYNYPLSFKINIIFIIKEVV